MADVTVTLNDPVTIVCAFVVGVLGTARVTRFIVDDDFPPMVWLRELYAGHVPEAWGALVECSWCVSFWVALADVGAAWASGLHWTWWLANTILAVAWLAAWLCMRDIPPDQR